MINIALVSNGEITDGVLFAKALDSFLEGYFGESFRNDSRSLDYTIYVSIVMLLVDSSKKVDAEKHLKTIIDEAMKAVKTIQEKQIN